MKNLPKVVVATDVCIFKIINRDIFVYLTEVHSSGEYSAMKTLPGSLVNLNENTDESIKRIVLERTSIDLNSLYSEQLYTFSDIERDRRSRAVSVAYFGLTSQTDDAGFVSYKKINNLAYDHNKIVNLAFERVASKLQYTNIASKILPKEFTYSDLQEVYELFGGKLIDKRNFRKKFDNLNLLQETNKFRQEGRMRPAKLYRFTSTEVKQIDML